jgi:hypothetical protein
MILEGETESSHKINSTYSKRKTRRINFDSFYEDDSFIEVSYKRKNRTSKFSTVDSLIVPKIFQCEKCEKKYLSYSALYSHKRGKHRNQNYQKKKKTYFPKIKYLEKCKEFYTYDERKSGCTDCVENLREFLENEKGSFFSKNSRIEGDELLNTLEKCKIKYIIFIFISLGLEFKASEAEDFTCDEIFCQYLLDIAKFTNKEYFTNYVLNFIFLLRDCVNKYGPGYKQHLLEYGIINEVRNNEVYTKVYNAEELPEVTNNFFEELDETMLKQKNISEFDFVELMLNFNTWLFYSDYTPYKICLINN